jgi:cyclic beta-1,2-glucan synthetase
LRRAGTTYEISVENPDRRCVGIATIHVDGVPVDGPVIPWTDDGGTHRVHAVLGEPAGTPRPVSEPAEAASIGIRAG